VDNLSWRWIFYVNLPVGGLALAVILVTMPSRPYKQEHSIDWLGAAILAAGTTALLLGLVWGGNEYPWGSPEVLGALMAAVVLIVAFGLVEHRVVEPILPFDLLRNQTFSSSVACMALVGAAMFGTISFVPLFVQGVIGTSATSSGVVLTPLILGAVATSVISGQIVSRTGRYRPNTLIGPVILGAGMFLLWRMDVHTTNGEAARNMIIAGIGLGMMMQIFVLSVQNSVPRAAMGTATALTQFSRSIGATLGVTLMGVIVNQNLPPTVSTSGVAIHRLPRAGRVALANALQPAFLSAVFPCAVVFVISLFWVREAPLRTALEVPSADDAYRTAVQRGARGIAEPHWAEDEFGRVQLSSIATYGDVIHTFVNRKDYAGPYLPGYRSAVENGHPDPGVGLKALDHVVGNVELGRMNAWVEF